MTPERWRLITDVFHRALALGPPERDAFVRRACEDDGALHAEVESMLAAHEDAGTFGEGAAATVTIDVQRLAPGTALGCYRIDTLIGAGGMGEVYRAHDTRLDRDVAIKVLPSSFSDDDERMTRFEREACLLAALSHPGIGAIHGLEESGNICALVLELIEGETLAARLGRGPLPLVRALEIAIQIAEALDHAHRRGVTHRDLKPSNVMLTTTGMKIFDFGLGRWARPLIASAGRLVRTVPTDGPSLTTDGAILGTLHYMAPEQLEGREADARSDLFAFGAVLYEMVTGRKAFDGGSQATLIAAILTLDPPPPSTIEPLAPARLDRVIAKCLSKDPDARWQSARDLADELKWIAEEGLRPITTAHRHPTGLFHEPTSIRRRVIGLRGAAAVVTITVAAVGGWVASSFTPNVSSIAPGIVRFVVQGPPTAPMAGNDFDITCDGSQLAYVGVEAGVQRVFLRRLDQFDATPVPGTEGAVDVFLSPDGEWVAFFADGKLQKVNIKAVSAPVVLCCAAGPIDMGGLNGATWTRDGSIIFATRHEGLQRVPAEGGQPTAVTTVAPDSSEIDYHNPHLLPDGKAILFAIHQSESRFSIAVQSLGSGQKRVLLEAGFAPTYSSSGHIVFARGSAILAVRFDVRRLEVVGAPIVLVENVATNQHHGLAAFRLSDNGSLVFEPGRSLTGRRLTWVDRSGAETLLPLAARSFMPPARVSPDGKHVAFPALDGDRQDIWVYEIATDKLTRITSATEGNNRGPLWTPDGQRLIYGSTRAGLQHLVWQPADGSGPAESLASSRNLLWPDAWTPDGRELLYVEQLPTDMPRGYVLHLDAKPWSEPLRQPVVVDLRYPKLSPDGRLVAFGSNVTGRVEVYVEPFARTGARLQVSVDGGRGPLWSRNGRELFYRRESQVLAAPVDARRLTAGKPVLLFDRRYVRNPLSGHDYDVTADGRFLLIKPSAEEQEPPHLNVALNWTDELRHRVPVVK